MVPLQQSHALGEEKKTQSYNLLWKLKTYLSLFLSFFFTERILFQE